MKSPRYLVTHTVSSPPPVILRPSSLSSPSRYCSTTKSRHTLPLLPDSRCNIDKLGMQIRVCRRGTGTAGDQKSCNGMATIKANGRGVGVTDRSRGQEEERRREGYLRSLPRREKLQLDSAWLETNPSVPSFRKVGSFRADVKMRELSKVFYYRDRSSAIDPHD